MSDPPEEVRLDRWLWAARMFRTRALARAAIAGGKVRVDGQPARPSRRVRPGMRITVRRGPEPEELEVLALSDRRGPASVAQTLYRETEASRARREAARQQRRQAGPPPSGGRPDRNSRRLIQRLKRGAPA